MYFFLRFFSPLLLFADEYIPEMTGHTIELSSILDVITSVGITLVRSPSVSMALMTEKAPVTAEAAPIVNDGPSESASGCPLWVDLCGGAEISTFLLSGVLGKRGDT